MSTRPILVCKHLGCKEKREGWPRSDIFCTKHADEQMIAAGKGRERPIILWCPNHGVITNAIQPHESRDCRTRHVTAGCAEKVRTFVLDAMR